VLIVEDDHLVAVEIAATNPYPPDVLVRAVRAALLRTP
jgi:hypothetical protein